jgi:ariadne-1
LTFLCKICCDVFPLSEGISLGCNHPYCKTCYTEYLRIKVNDGQACILAHCPEPKCKQIVTKDVFHGLLTAEDSSRYDTYYIRNFVEMSKHMKYCPAPRCEKGERFAVNLSFCFLLSEILFLSFFCFHCFFISHFCMVTFSPFF